MEIIVKTELDKLREENQYLQAENNYLWKLRDKLVDTISAFELVNKELQAEVERLRLLCMSPFK